MNVEECRKLSDIAIRNCPGRNGYYANRHTKSPCNGSSLPDDGVFEHADRKRFSRRRRLSINGRDDSDLASKQQPDIPDVFHIRDGYGLLDGGLFME